MYIAIDTSTDFASLALVQDDQIIGEITWRCGRNHTAQLLPSLSVLLDRAGLEVKAATGIIVARGPGSYNGLRVGLSTAKALAFSLGVPLVGISTLEVEAYQHAERGLAVCPIFNAGRGEVAAAVYRQQGDEWTRLIAEHVTTLEALAARISRADGLLRRVRRCGGRRSDRAAGQEGDHRAAGKPVAPGRLSRRARAEAA